MSGVPYTFANATTTIALSNLDANFATPVTIGNTSVALGNTVTTLGNVTLAGATITSAPTAAPCFSAYTTSTQSVSGGTSTKITMASTEFNIGTGWDTSNSWFKPSVAGYYFFNGQIAISTAQNRLIPTIYKNGSSFKTGSDIGAPTFEATTSALIYLNGSTDYVEFYVGYIAVTSALNGAGPATNFFQGFLARSA